MDDLDRYNRSYNRTTVIAALGLAVIILIVLFARVASASQETRICVVNHGDRPYASKLVFLGDYDVNEGPLYVKGATTWGDIIPDGQNWTAHGRLIWEQDCYIHAQSPSPSPSESPSPTPTESPSPSPSPSESPSESPTPSPSKSHTPSTSIIPPISGSLPPDLPVTGPRENAITFGLGAMGVLGATGLVLLLVMRRKTKEV